MRLLNFLIVILALSISSCKPSTTTQPKFEHDVLNGPKPWTSENFELEEEDFTFAIISDLTGGERESVFSIAVEQINRIEPTFVLSIGDLIDGGTEDVLKLEKEWDSFDARASKLDMPFFYLGGNHDLTNPIMREFWKQRFGPRFYHFVYENVLFLMIDSEDFEEERMKEIYLARAKALKVIHGEIEGEYTDTEYYHMLERRTGAMTNSQFEYHKKILNKYQQVKWTFVLMHKPMWTRDDEKGLSRLEKLLENRPYTVINGHEHSFSHTTRNNRDYMMLGTTGGAQKVGDSAAFDHITLIRMAKEKPVITHLKMSGILDERGHIPLGGDSISFQAKYK